MKSAANLRLMPGMLVKFKPGSFPGWIKDVNGDDIGETLAVYDDYSPCVDVWWPRVGRVDTGWFADRFNVIYVYTSSKT